MNNSGGSINATTGLYTAGTTANTTDTVRVTDTLGGSTDAIVTVISGAANKLAFRVQPSTTAAGISITPAVEVAVQDSFGNLVTTATNAVTLSILNNPGNGTLSGTLIRNAVGGIAAFNNLSINNLGTGYTLRATATSLVNATSSGFNIVVGSPARLAFSVQPSNAVANIAISPAVRVSVLDSQGNLVTTATHPITVAILNNPAGGTVSGTLTRNAVSGIAMLNDLSINNIGNGYTLTANSAPLTSTTSAAFNILSPFIVTNTNDGGGGSFRNAIVASNAAAGTQTISFNISGPVPFTIAPISPLPAIIQPVIIDGTSQPGFAGNPIIELNGVSAGAGSARVGLKITGGGRTV